MAELNEDPFSPDWGQVDKGDPRAVSDALYTLWQRLNPAPGSLGGLILPGDPTLFLRGDGTFALPLNGLVWLHSAKGTDSHLGATTVDSVVIVGLTEFDTLVVEFTLTSVTQPTALPSLYSVVDAVSLVTLLNGGDLGAGVRRVGSARSRQQPADPTMASTYSNTVDGFSQTHATIASWVTSITLGLRHNGVTAGGTFKWSWSVYRMTGQ